MVAMLVKCALNKKKYTDNVTSKAHPHYNTSSAMLYGGKYTCGDHPFTYTASHNDTVVGTKNLQFGFQTKRHISTGLMDIACVSCPFISGFFSVIWPWRPDSHSLFWTVDAEMCLLLELCEAFIQCAISEAGNSNELLYRRRTHSHYITSNIIHINLLRFATHIISCLNFLTSVALAHRQTGKGKKWILLEPISSILNIKHLKALVLTFIIPLMAVTLQARIMVNLDWE